MNRNPRRILGFTGALVMVLGALMPCAHFTFVHVYAFSGTGPGLELLAIAAFAAIFTYQQRYAFLTACGIISAIRLLEYYVGVRAAAVQESALAGIGGGTAAAHALRSFVFQGTYVEWGFYFALLGAALLFATGVLHGSRDAAGEYRGSGTDAAPETH